MAIEKSPLPLVEFCGSTCWKKGGQETAAALSAGAANLRQGEAVQARIDGATEIVVRKAYGCIGACGKNPAACVKTPGKETVFFTADSVEAVENALSSAGPDR